MQIQIDNAVGAGAAARPFLLTVTLTPPAEGASLATRLQAVCEQAVAGDLPEAAWAIETYRAELQRLGRNPNRYRISSDALWRRCLRDGAVPSILPLVDLNNIISIRTGWPVGCYDADLIDGQAVLRLGGEGEIMPTLGKGDFDIHRLPVLADATGPFGSTISDSVRTAVTETARRAVMVVYGCGEGDEAALANLVAGECAAAGVEIRSEPCIIR